MACRPEYFHSEHVYSKQGTTSLPTMSYTLEISDELKERLDAHLEEDETLEEFIEELVSMYETEGMFLQEGYSE